MKMPHSYVFVSIIILVLLITPNAMAEDELVYTITGNQISDADNSQQSFDHYIEAAGPIMVEEKISALLFDVTKILGSNPSLLKEGDIVGFTSSTPASMKALFSRGDFQAVLPLLQNSLRGHWGYQVATPLPTTKSIDPDSNYLLTYVAKNCDGSPILPDGRVPIAQWAPILSGTEAVEIRSFNLFESPEADSMKITSMIGSESCWGGAILRYRSHIG